MGVAVLPSLWATSDEASGKKRLAKCPIIGGRLPVFQEASLLTWARVIYLRAAIDWLLGSRRYTRPDVGLRGGPPAAPPPAGQEMGLAPSLDTSTPQTVEPAPRIGGLPTFPRRRHPPGHCRDRQPPEFSPAPRHFVLERPCRPSDLHAPHATRQAAQFHPAAPRLSPHLPVLPRSLLQLPATRARTPPAPSPLPHFRHPSAAWSLPPCLKRSSASAIFTFPEFTEWHKIAAWGKLASTISSVAKGAREGRRGTPQPRVHPPTAARFRPTNSSPARSRFSPNRRPPPEGRA